MTNPTDNDSTVLVSRILHIAHIADKNLSTNPEQAEALKAAYAQPLRNCLAQLPSGGGGADPSIGWARDILAELENQTPVPSRGDIGLDDDKASRMFHMLDVVRTRRSVRQWTSDPIPEAMIDQLVEAARWAPSSGNRQAVRIVVLTSPEARAIVAPVKERFLAKAPMILLIGADMRVYGEAERRTGLPCLDGGAVIQNMLLVAHSLGLGCCWSKWCEDDWELQPALFVKVKAQLKLPGSFRPMSLVAVGWPAAKRNTPPRKAASEFVRHNLAGFPPDAYPEWRPAKIRRFVHRLIDKLSKGPRRFLAAFLVENE
jgi:nitroreductase